ncbi:MAG TPA: nuclear transport factor 2 family protein [Cyclobacteriaceae bacterium]|nr:nuclear transport factor 2 family protein [Cyclobacteriaceae bacterium]
MKHCFLLFACLLLGFASSFAQQKNKALEKKVEDLRLLLISPERASLERITSPQLSYGHSNGRIENQKEFVEYLLSGVSKFVTIELQDQTVDVVEDIGIVRHILVAETNNQGETVHIKIGVLLIWKLEEKEWKLLARQAFKI